MEKTRSEQLSDNCKARRLQPFHLQIHPCGDRSDHFAERSPSVATSQKLHRRDVQISGKEHAFPIVKGLPVQYPLAVGDPELVREFMVFAEAEPALKQLLLTFDSRQQVLCGEDPFDLPPHRDRHTGWSPGGSRRASSYNPPGV